MNEYVLYACLGILSFTLLILRVYSHSDYRALKLKISELNHNEVAAKLAFRRSGWLTKYWVRITTPGAERWF